MCDQNSLQQHIRKLTNNGEVVARFLTETVQGKTPGAKACHQVKAMEYLVRFGLSEDTAANNTPSPSMGEGWDGGDTPAHPQHVEEPAEAQDRLTDSSELNTDNSPVSYLDILNFNLAQLVRSETAEGHTIAQFLYHVMTGRDEPFTPNKYKIKPADRMTAAMEIIRRGHGHFGRRRKLIDDADETNDYDTLHTDLAKRLRQYGEHGSQAIRFLLDVMENDFPDDQFTYRHRLSAVLELNRRGWDTNYDRIKMEHLMDYWRDQEDARLSVGQKKHLAGLHTYVDEYDQYDDKGIKDYESIAKQLHEQQDRESEPPRRYRASRKPEGPGNGSINTPSPSTEEGRDGGEKDKKPSPSCASMSSSTPDPEQDCYYEPLSPEDQAIFDYETRLETGSYEEGEIEIRPVTEASRQEYAATLKWMQQVATEEGVPLLPNPLSGTLTHPNARSP